MAELLKDLYNEQYIELLSSNISSVYPAFKSDKFTKSIFYKEWRFLELKQRMRHIATILGLQLPTEYKTAITILEQTFVKMNDAYYLENMIFQDFVEVYGLDDFETSLYALEIFTVKSSSEFAIRQFILYDTKKTMSKMKLWAESNNEHIRRLASEGCRSRLPWAVGLPAFKKDPTLVIEILKLLKDDESAYVRKSVANNINDISKDHPKVVINLVKRWLCFSKNRDAILKHGCRTLLKASNREILKLFGFTQPTDIKLVHFTHTQNVKMGEELEFSFEIESEKNLGKLRVEFDLKLLRKNNKHNSKVFKISEFETQNKSKIISKKYSFRPITTRVYYKGIQKLSIIINGVVLKEVEFMLF